METPEHLTDAQMSRYRERKLSAVELLDLDSHISSCSDCRDRLSIEHRATARAQSLRADLAGHLVYADIVQCSEGNGKPNQLNHLRECPKCRAEVQDLSRFRTELLDTPRRPIELPVKPWARYRIPLGIAAAVLVVAGATTFALRRPATPAAPTQAVAPAPQADPEIPAAERQILQAAITTGTLERAPVLDNLIARRGTLLSPTAPRPAITLLAPVGTTVLSDRPVLRWTMSPDATSYVVAVFDEKFQKLAESPALTVTDWRPSDPLPRGKVLNWQVTMRTASGTVHAPTPPEPEARFQVVEQAVVDRIEQMRRDFPGNPLLLAALYAHAGALDEAAAILQLMDDQAAQSYKEHLRKIRRDE